MIDEDSLSRYEVIVKTADEANADTNANVLLGIFGEKADVLYAPLLFTDLNESAFDRGSVNRFHLKLKDTGTIKKIVIKHDGTGKNASWKLDYIKIIHERQIYLFEVDMWLDATKMYL